MIIFIYNYCCLNYLVMFVFFTFSVLLEREGGGREEREREADCIKWKDRCIISYIS